MPSLQSLRQIERVKTRLKLCDNTLPSGAHLQPIASKWRMAGHGPALNGNAPSAGRCLCWTPMTRASYLKSPSRLLLSQRDRVLCGPRSKAIHRWTSAVNHCPSPRAAGSVQCIDYHRMSTARNSRPVALIAIAGTAAAAAADAAAQFGTDSRSGWTAATAAAAGGTARPRGRAGG